MSLDLSPDSPPSTPPPSPPPSTPPTSEEGGGSGDDQAEKAGACDYMQRQDEGARRSRALLRDAGTDWSATLWVRLRYTAAPYPSMGASLASLDAALATGPRAGVMGTLLPLTQRQQAHKGGWTFAARLTRRTTNREIRRLHDYLDRAMAEDVEVEVRRFDPAKSPHTHPHNAFATDPDARLEPAVDFLPS
jgi:hypothetical protein